MTIILIYNTKNTDIELYTYNSRSKCLVSHIQNIVSSHVYGYVVEVKLYPTFFYTAVHVKVYYRSSSNVADKIFGNPYSVHLRYEVGHNKRVHLF